MWGLSVSRGGLEIAAAQGRPSQANEPWPSSNSIGGAGRYHPRLIIRPGQAGPAQVGADRCASPNVFQQIPPLRRHRGKQVTRLALAMRTAFMNEFRHSCAVERHSVASAMAKSVALPHAALDHREIRAIGHQQIAFLLVHDPDQRSNSCNGSTLGDLRGRPGVVRSHLGRGHGRGDGNVAQFQRLRHHPVQANVQKAVL